jgi:signal transduction histidine kinase
VDPLPLLIQAMNDVEGLRSHRERLFTILAELYSNALEHGLLRLDSDLKATPAGFSDYYRQRDARLARLQSGFITFDLEHAPLPQGGRLVIRVTDSGPGFDLTQVERRLDHNTGYRGRGIPLVRTLCESVRYRGRNNIAEATYVWA